MKCSWQWVSIGSDNGLTPTVLRQAITWNSNERPFTDIHTHYPASIFRIAQTKKNELNVFPISLLHNIVTVIY